VAAALAVPCLVELLHTCSHGGQPGAEPATKANDVGSTNVDVSFLEEQCIREIFY
jgi:hypothetical protein